MLAIAAAKLGFDPVLGVDADRAAVEETRRNARANYVEVEVRHVDLRREPAPVADVVAANLTAGLCEAVARWWASAASGPAAAIASGFLREEADRVAGGAGGGRARGTPPRGVRRVGRDPGVLSRLDSAPVTTFHTKFLGCKVSQADAMLARARLLEAGHDEAPEDEADLHVVNTCCITREAEAKSRQSVRRSARGRAGRRVRRDRVRREPERGAVRRDRAAR